MHAYRADMAFDGERVLPGGALVFVDGDAIVGVEPAGTIVCPTLGRRFGLTEPPPQVKAPAAEALATATSRAADACRIGDRTGRLRAGLSADLLLVDGDPLHDITALRDVRLVVARGTAYSGS